MDRCAIDSSVLVGALFRGLATELVVPAGRGLLLSASSYAETLAAAVSRGVPLDGTVAAIDRLAIEVVPLDVPQAVASVRLRGLAGDPPLPAEIWHALALAALRAIPLRTADPRLSTLRLGVEVECLR